MLFVSAIINYANHRQNGFSWSNSFWNEHQFDIALHFPEEAFKFAAILDVGNKPGDFRFKQLSIYQKSALKLANKLLQPEETNPYFQHLKDNISSLLTQED